MKVFKVSLAGVLVGVGVLGGSISSEGKSGDTPNRKAVGVINKEVVSLKNPDGSMEIYRVDKLLEYAKENNEKLEECEREIIDRIEKNSERINESQEGNILKS